jgi:hypothetical protein
MFVPVSRSTLFLLFLAFGVSVLLRAPMLNRPLSGHHEFCTAFSLIILENWHRDGLLTHSGAPPLTSNAPGDRGATWMGAGSALNNGRYYYLSHPPLGLYLPHLWFRIWNTSPSAWGLQVFGLLLHGLFALGVMRAMAWFAKGDAPLIAGVLVLFMPAPLWFLGNVYMSDIMVVVPWVWHVVAAQRLFGDVGNRPRGMVAFALGLGIVVYTGWLGILAAVVDLGLTLYRWKRWSGRDRTRLVMGIALAVFIPMVLTAWAYSDAVGQVGLVDYLQGRFRQRSTALGVGEEGALYHLGHLLMNYRTGFLPVLLVLIAAVPFALRALRSGTPRIPPGAMLFTVLTAGPVVLEHALLLEYADHDFVALKGAPFLCGTAALVLAAVGKQPWARWFPVSGLLLISALGAGYFWHLNADAGTSVHKDRGLIITRQILSEQVLFWTGPPAEPQMVWYAKRTPWSVSSVDEARAILVRTGQAQGVLFSPDPGGHGLQWTVVDALP